MGNCFNEGNLTEEYSILGNDGLQRNSASLLPVYENVQSSSITMFSKGMTPVKNTESRESRESSPVFRSALRRSLSNNLTMSFNPVSPIMENHHKPFRRSNTQIKPSFLSKARDTLRKEAAALSRHDSFKEKSSSEESTLGCSHKIEAISPEKIENYLFPHVGDMPPKDLTLNLPN